MTQGFGGFLLWVPVPMVLVPGMAAPAELVGLVPDPQPGQEGGPFGARGQLTHERPIPIV